MVSGCQTLAFGQRRRRTTCLWGSHHASRRFAPRCPCYGHRPQCRCMCATNIVVPRLRPRTPRQPRGSYVASTCRPTAPACRPAGSACYVCYAAGLSALPQAGGEVAEAVGVAGWHTLAYAATRRRQRAFLRASHVPVPLRCVGGCLCLIFLHTNQGHGGEVSQATCIWVTCVCTPSAIAWPGTTA